MGRMPMKIPRKTAAAARPGSRLSFSRRVTNVRALTLNRRITESCSEKAKCEGPETDPHHVPYRLHLGACVALVIDHTNGSVCDGAARPGHLDENFHLEFVVAAAQFSFIQLVQPEQAESTLAVADFAADERGS